MIGLCRHCTLCRISEQLFINKTGCYGSIRCYEISVYFMLCIDNLHCHWPNVRESPCVAMWLGYYWKTYYQESYYSVALLSNGFCGIWSQGQLHDKGERREILTWHTISTDTKYWMIDWLTHGHSVLTHLPLGKIAAISQTINSYAFSWMKSYVFWLTFHLSLFLRVKVTITHHWFR